jgi:glycosyltransferase involved in cell wall biosynthesis
VVKEQLEFHIAIPFGGHESYLHETLESVLCQTYESWRLFILCDGMDDSTTRSLSLKYSDSRIQFSAFPQKQGIGRMFNLCLGKLNSDWNILLGADDLLSPNFLVNTLEGIVENPDVDIIQPQTKVIDSVGEIVTPLEDLIKNFIRFRSKSHIFKPRHATYSLAIGNWLYFPSIVWSSRALRSRNFDESYEVALDLDFVLKILSDGGKILYWPKSLFFYRRHLASVSMRPERYLRRATEEALIYDRLSINLVEKKQYFGALIAKVRVTCRLNLMLKLFTNKKLDRKQLIHLLLKV